MVSFSCEACINGCGDVLTGTKKANAHLNRCWKASFTCLDCMTNFSGYDYQKHTSCVSEAQKYEGALYKDKKQKPTSKVTPSGLPHTPMIPKHAYVEEAEDSPNPNNAVVEIDAPPPAPSPPSAAPPAYEPDDVNVFDFMVDAEARSPSLSSESSFVSSSTSSFESRRPDDDDDELMSPQSSSPGRTMSQLHQAGYTYGSGPVKPSIHKFDSEFDFSRHLEDQFGPPLPGVTPPQHTREAAEVSQQNGDSKSKSEKKRKRPEVEDLDLTVSKRDPDTTRKLLHSGLTGGLGRLLSQKQRREEDSPLSPKKRSRHSKVQESPRDDVSKSKRKDKDRSRVHKDRESKEERREKRRHKELKAIEAPPKVKQIGYYGNGEISTNGTAPQQRKHQSHSEFFLSIVDKDHHSRKGMSIYGALKTFHEGIYSASDDGVNKSTWTQEKDERRLFKGLRMKLNKHGEIVLFARPDIENED